MQVPKGSIVEIRTSKVHGGDVLRGVLSEDVTLSLSSQFKDLFSELSGTAASVQELMTTVGSTLKMFGGAGFSGRFKQGTAQIWDKTSPISFSLNIDFHRVPFEGNKNVSGKNVMDIVKKFCSIPLPSENAGGNLNPPGISPIEGIGLDALKDWISGDTETNLAKTNRGYINVTIGGMTFNRLLMTKAEPTFSKYMDDSGYPISCRVNFEFISLWAATQDMVAEW